MLSSVSAKPGLSHLPGVAAQDDVVEATGDVQAGFAGHWASIVKGRALCN
jgi:hypothetical protein